MAEWFALDEYAQLPAAPGVYVIRHIATGREYVGQSLDVRKRIKSHRAADAQHYLGRAIRAHGKAAFEACFWAAGAPADLGDMEIALIAARGTMAPAGYNLAAGGLGPTGVEWSDERKAAQSARVRGVPLALETREKMSAAATARNPFKGKTHSAETRAKMGAAAIALHTGRKRSDETKARISASLMGRAAPVIPAETRARMAEARRGVPNPSSSQPGAKNGMYGICGKDHPSAKSIGVWHPESMLPIIYESAGEAAAALGVSRSRISEFLSGGRRPKTGYAVAVL